VQQQHYQESLPVTTAQQQHLPSSAVNSFRTLALSSTDKTNDLADEAPQLHLAL